MVSTDNLLAVITNIYGINIVTRNKMKNAISRDQMDNLKTLINESDHIDAEVRVILQTMLTRIDQAATKKS